MHDRAVRILCSGGVGLTGPKRGWTVDEVRGGNKVIRCIRKDVHVRRVRWIVVLECGFGSAHVVYAALQRGSNGRGEDGGWGEEWGRGREQLLISVFSEEKSVGHLDGLVG